MLGDHCVPLKHFYQSTEKITKRTRQFKELPKRFGQEYQRSPCQRRLGRAKAFTGNPLEQLEAMAVSDGELNITEVDGHVSEQVLNINASLPSVQSNECYTERAVASWAVSFERLLQDPIGVKYFTAFLKKEFSAENILFWQACESFQQIPANDSKQLAEVARKIFNTYLSSSSLSPINIDKQAQLEEDVLNSPTSDMFKAQQLQIFNLMKFDSYARFAKSPLYQQCMLADVEGRPLPDIELCKRSPVSECRTNGNSSSPSGSKKKQRLKSGKSFSGSNLESSDRRGGSTEKQIWRNSSKLSRRKEKRDSLGAEFTESNGFSLTRRESQGSVYSTASVELGFLSSLTARGEKSENERPISSVPETEKEQAIKYCCIYLPDGTSSLVKVRAGLTIRDLLLNICERHGIPMAATSIYLTRNEKKPLVLDQDCMILSDQELRVEKKILFELELVPINKKLWVTAKPNKTVAEALQPFLIKYKLNAKEMEAKISGESQTLKSNVKVSCLENQRVVLDSIRKTQRDKTSEVIKNVSRSSSSRLETYSGSKGSYEVASTDSTKRRGKGSKEEMKQVYRKTYDVEALFELLSKAQSSRANDQRGLLSKDHLVLPDFLQLPEELSEFCIDSPVSEAGDEKIIKGPTQPENKPGASQWPSDKGTAEGGCNPVLQSALNPSVKQSSTAQATQGHISYNQKSACSQQSSNIRGLGQPSSKELNPNQGSSGVTDPAIAVHCPADKPEVQQSTVTGQKETVLTQHCNIVSESTQKQADPIDPPAPTPCPMPILQ
ncbi:regulator of G-protein signaling 14 isoform X1 [Callorhinchus milii]|uniref:regulator of G-protein signaling 14 isoform X1 n=1 Tax=Callorhinchus milii TaxID=7868 RepID=UPI001C3FC5E5|nr:regulator of G-protein signaling 14 isoform X1 [Callorhinchus milii]